MLQGDYGDISYRKDLRRRLRCKSFGWYLQTLLPSMEIPEKNLYSGEVRVEIYYNSRVVVVVVVVVAVVVNVVIVVVVVVVVDKMANLTITCTNQTLFTGT